MRKTEAFADKVDGSVGVVPTQVGNIGFFLVTQCHSPYRKERLSRQPGGRLGPNGAV